MESHYQTNPISKYCQAIKHMLKYLRRTKDYMLEYPRRDLTPFGYMDSNFYTCRDLRKSTSSCVFFLDSGAIVLRRLCTIDSTMEAKYVVASNEMKEVWLQKFLIDIEVILSMEKNYHDVL